MAGVKLDLRLRQLDRRTQRNRKRTLRRLGALVRIIARRSLPGGQGKASPPGKPPRSRSKTIPNEFTEKGNPRKRSGALRRSILWGLVGDRSVIVGPSADLISNIGEAHEKGGRFRTPGSAPRQNWKLTVGGHGPIRFRRRKGPGRRRRIRSARGGSRETAEQRENLSDPVIAKLRTPSEVARARRLAKLYRRRVGNRLQFQKPARNYPQRSYMVPAVRKAIASPQWTNILQDSFR